MRLRIACIVVLVAACSTARGPLAPWQSDPIENVPAVYRTEWERAENRASCALVAFEDTLGEDATPRRANFSGGWAVAYDTAAKRSAFGIAGTGASADQYHHSWSTKRLWDDGSYATWGPEGGTGPNYLAYVRIDGQDCLYNVWSARSEEHLERLLEQIRFVRRGL